MDVHSCRPTNMNTSVPKALIYLVVIFLMIYINTGSCVSLHRSGQGQNQGQGHPYNATEFCARRGGHCLTSRGDCATDVEFFLGYCDNHKPCCRSKREVCAEHFHGFCCDSVQECLAIEDYTINWLTCDGTSRCCLPAAVTRRSSRRGTP